MIKSSCGVVGVVFRDGRNEVLLIKRRDIPVWALPGGGVDPHETPEASVVREIQEETGLLTRVVRHVALYTPINRLSMTTFVFECEVISGELASSVETKEVRFFPFNSLPRSLFFIHRDWAEETRKGHLRTLYAPLAQVTYWNLLIYFLKHPIQVFRMVLVKCKIPYNS